MLDESLFCRLFWRDVNWSLYYVWVTKCYLCHIIYGMPCSFDILILCYNLMFADFSYVCFWEDPLFHIVCSCRQRACSLSTTQWELATVMSRTRKLWLQMLRNWLQTWLHCYKYSLRQTLIFRYISHCWWQHTICNGPLCWHILHLLLLAEDLSPQLPFQIILVN